MLRVDPAADVSGDARPAEVLIVTRFEARAHAWTVAEGRPTGTAGDYPDVHCNVDDIRVATNGMGLLDCAAQEDLRLPPSMCN
ncbi:MULTISPECIES: hypothetical protein [unclassified Caballeronia]|uniref:hypothetical protein n=1 Tax=unclassified Caballeronia TaxID=2646786 RepID=UPI00285F5D1E|nr:MULTISPECIES: hypothetical protein [unclassified Caballeronia]MDR5739533.1 hypothetical protein [Caballeronia sp. LZ016]MDR5808001.1 hypothetical protein [Caballeronia sp. LZ019]